MTDYAALAAQFGGQPDAPQQDYSALAQQLGGRPVEQTPNPADQSQYPEATPFNNFRAGMGKAFHDLALGYQQVMGKVDPLGHPLGALITPEMIDKQRELDRPLMGTTAGKAGEIVGDVAATLPLAVIPGVNTIPGALAAGATYGAMEPTGAGDNRAVNMAKDAALFALAPVAGAALKTGKALVQPLYQGGREAIVGQTLNRFAGSDPALVERLANPQTFVPGSVPTTADASGNAALAMLENGAATRDPLVKQAFATRLQGNNAARAEALKSIAGDEAKRQFFEDARNATAQELYNRAFAETPENSPWIKGQVTALMQRPAFVDALKQAQEIALNQGIKVSPENPENTTQILHYAKMALDDAQQKAMASGSPNAARGIADTKARLVSLMESKNFSPSYREARDTYAKMSQPINQMDIGQYLYEKLQPALNEFGGTTRNRAASYADALRNADATAGKATGYKGARLADIMSPEQMDILTNVARDLSRRSATEDAMRGIGSNTGQNLAAQNIVASIVGPLGLPQSFGQNALKNLLSVPYLGGAIKFGTSGAEEAVQNELAKALLDPQRAAELIRRTQPGQTRNLLTKLLSGGKGGSLALQNTGQ